jgi:hypothetical protein
LVIIQIGCLGWLVSQEEKIWMIIVITLLIGMAFATLYSANIVDLPIVIYKLSHF